jgi:hypothetical protein
MVFASPDESHCGRVASATAVAPAGTPPIRAAVARVIHDGDGWCSVPRRELRLICASPLQAIS